MKFGRIVLDNVSLDMSGFLTRRHTFKISAMTSARRSLLHMQQRPPVVRQSAEGMFSKHAISRSNKYECTMHQELWCIQPPF